MSEIDDNKTGEGIKTTLPGPQQDERPGRVDSNNQITDPSTSGPKKPKSKDNFDSDDLEREKYDRAFVITVISIIAVVVVWLVDGLFKAIWKIDTPNTDSVIDLFKYVLTASLSFYFGTTISKKDSK